MISVKRVIRCTKFNISRIRGSGVITISMLNFWTGGGAIEFVLETPTLVTSLFRAITTSVPNVLIFLCSLHRVAIDSHWEDEEIRQKIDPWFGMTQGIHRHQDYNFLTDCSKVLSENVHFWYLTTRRWRCSQLWHGPSEHGVDEVYRVSFWLIKVWLRYSLWTNLGHLVKFTTS